MQTLKKHVDALFFVRKIYLLGDFMYYFNQNNAVPVKNVALDAVIQNIIISSGISPRLYGYRYLKETIKMVMNSPRLMNNITKELYPTVAKAFDTTPAKVERSIRHAIELAWASGKIYYVNSLYGIAVFDENHKPTNSEFIALIGDKLLLELEFNGER